jgi:uncharacterized membrane protein YeaQ/YmgE (transglycosylase-associated protein family)
MSIFAWIILGLIAGAIAKALHPGPDPGGIIVTMLVGIAGAFLGGLIGHALFGRGVTGFNLSSFLLAIGGSFLLLVLYRWGVQRSRHGTPGPTPRSV